MCCMSWVWQKRSDRISSLPHYQRCQSVIPIPSGEPEARQAPGRGDPLSQLCITLFYTPLEKTGKFLYTLDALQEPEGTNTSFFLIASAVHTFIFPPLSINIFTAPLAQTTRRRHRGRAQFPESTNYQDYPTSFSCMNAHPAPTRISH
jgi:hypothetical protein